MARPYKLITRTEEFAVERVSDYIVDQLLWVKPSLWRPILKRTMGKTGIKLTELHKLERPDSI